NSPADVLMTVDAGRLYRAKQEGILQSIDSPALEAAVPAHLQDKDNEWFGLSQRARVVFYSKDRVKPEELSTYEDLASDKWKGRICIRSSGNIYNLSMMAAMISRHGEEKAKEW